MIAQDMFKELGYYSNDREDGNVEYGEGRHIIIFNNITKKHHHRQNNRYGGRTYIGGITLKLHKAIHQQMKELGWLK